MHFVVGFFLLITALESEESFENENQVARLETQNSGIVDIVLLILHYWTVPSISQLLGNLVFCYMKIFFLTTKVAYVHLLLMDGLIQKLHKHFQT